MQKTRVQLLISLFGALLLNIKRMIQLFGIGPSPGPEPDMGPPPGISGPDFGPAPGNSTIDAIALFVMAVIVFFVSLQLYNRILKKNLNNAKLIAVSLLYYGVITCFSSLARTPIKDAYNQHLPWQSYLIDELIMNASIIIISYVVVRYHFQQKANQEKALQYAALETENAQLQLKSLSQQLNPHFFFNSLNTLSELIYIDTEKSDEFIGNLSSVFRYVLQKEESGLVNLDEELQFIQKYFALMQLRFEDKVCLSISVENAVTYEIPSQSLLLLVENCFKHNAISAEKPMTIEIFEETEGYLTVKNNRNALKQIIRESLGVGLKNLDNRCKLLLNRGVVIKENNDFYAVSVPIKNTKHEHSNH